VKPLSRSLRTLSDKVKRVIVTTAWWVLRQGDGPPIRIMFSISCCRQPTRGCPLVWVLIGGRKGGCSPNFTVNDRYTDMQLRGAWFKFDHVVFLIGITEFSSVLLVDCNCSQFVSTSSFYNVQLKEGRRNGSNGKILACLLLLLIIYKT